MSLPKLVIVQATECRAPSVGCSIEGADGKYHCCARSPQPHANALLFNVPGGLGVSQECVSAYCCREQFREKTHQLFDNDRCVLHLKQNLP